MQETIYTAWDCKCGRAVINNRLYRSLDVIFAHILFVCASVLLLTTNVIAQDSVYPSEWPTPQIASGNQCVELTGHYRYVGEIATSDRSSDIDISYRTITVAFGYAPSGDIDVNSVVEIIHYKNRGALRAIVTEKVPHLDLSIIPLEVQCMHGWWVSESTFSGAYEGFTHNAKTVVKLIKANDESVIIYKKVDSTSSSFFGLRSIHDKNETWYRFQNVQKK